MSLDINQSSIPADIMALSQAKYLKVDKKTGSIVTTNWLSNIFEKIKGKIGFCDWTDIHLIQSQTLYLIEKIGNNTDIQLITALALRVGLLPEKTEKPRDIGELTYQIFRQMILNSPEKRSEIPLFLFYRKIHQKNLSKFKDFFSLLPILRQSSETVIPKPLVNVIDPLAIEPQPEPVKAELFQKASSPDTIQEAEPKREPELPPEPKAAEAPIMNAAAESVVQTPEKPQEQTPQNILKEKPEKKPETAAEAPPKEENKFAKIDARIDKELSEKSNINPVIFYLVAMDHFKDRGNEIDARITYRYCKAAAERGVKEAQYLLSVIYQEGTAGVAQNTQEAFRWCKLAAEQGDAHSQLQFGKYYQNGFGTEIDLIEAHKWYQKAADQEEVEAQWLMGCFHEKKAKTTAENGLKEVAEAEIQKAIEWHTKAAEKGFADAQDHLGLLYWERGKMNGKEADLKLAFNWCEKAANQGVETAQMRLGVFYITGVGVKSDFNKGVVWSAKAAKQGNKMAEEIILDVKTRFRAANGEKMIIETEKAIAIGKQELEKIEKVLEQHKAVPNQELEGQLEKLRRQSNEMIEFVTFLKTLR